MESLRFCTLIAKRGRNKKMLKFSDVKVGDIKTDALIILLCEDADINYEKNRLRLIEDAFLLNEFSGKAEEDIIFYSYKETAATRIILTGIGKLEKTNPEIIRSAVGKAVKKCIAKKLTNAAIVIPSSDKLKIKAEDIVKAVGEGACLANHIFDKYKSEKETKPLDNFYMLVSSDTKKELTGLIDKIETICAGTILAREWVSTPSNEKIPEVFAQSILNLAKKEKIEATLLTAKDITCEKMGGILGVSSGSQAAPCMLILDYNPENSRKTYAFVGKGITFDSGGINLKLADSLKDMKMDMSGAAAVAASLITSARLKIGARIIGVMPLVENMPSGSALRPGDIIESYSGKSIEIGNTDAEGRLILADALSYTEKKYNPDAIIDIATLTGACIVALGEKVAGLFSSDDSLVKSILESGERVHERCWRLPMPYDYKKLLKSEIADISNIGSSRWGGAITAAIFLSEFVEKKSWAHIDIAGPAFIAKPESYCNSGGTGFGVRLIVDLVSNISEM